MTPGTEVNIPMTFNVVLHLEPGSRYSWVLDVDGPADDTWQMSFETRQAQAAPGVRPLPAAAPGQPVTPPRPWGSSGTPPG